MGCKDRSGVRASRWGPGQDPASFWVVVLLSPKITNSNVSKCKADRTQTNNENASSRGAQRMRVLTPGDSHRVGDVRPAHTSWPTSRHFSLAHVLAQLAFDACLGPTWLGHTHTISVPQFLHSGIPNIVKNPKQRSREDDSENSRKMPATADHRGRHCALHTLSHDCPSPHVQCVSKPAAHSHTPDHSKPRRLRLRDGHLCTPVAHAHAHAHACPTAEDIF